MPSMAPANDLMFGSSFENYFDPKTELSDNKNLKTELSTTESLDNSKIGLWTVWAIGNS